VPFIRGLGKKLGQTAYGQQQEQTARAEQWTANECARLIQEITEGTDYYRIILNGQVRAFPAAQLTGLALEELRGKRALVNLRRTVEGLSREEQRDVVRQLTTDARGYEIFREGDKTELDVTVGFKDSGNGYQVVGEGPHSRPTAGRMDRSASVAESAKQIFISPVTGQFYSRAELYKLSDTNRALFKTLMRTDNNFLNELLAQAN
jgi:hypothetical protein